MSIRNVTVATFALLLIVGVAEQARAQSTSFDIEAGYQWVDITGNEDMYRTQVNQDDGFVLGNFSLHFVDPSGDASFVDDLRIRAAGFGGNPAGRFRLQMGLGTSYRFRLFYNRYETYSALPAFANPFVEDGIIPGQHTWERDREIVDLELELFPGHKLTPIVGYRWNRIEGPRRTTYHVGADEFQLTSDLEETESEFYAGLAFVAGRFNGAVIQGWREFESRDSLGLFQGAGGGNNSNPVLGVDVSMDSFDRTVRTDAETPVTTFHIRGPFTEWARLIASYARADYESDTFSSEMLSGSLVSFELRRLFGGLDQSIESRTENPSWRGELRLEFDLGSRTDLRVGYERRHRELKGWAMVSNLYLETLNFSGFDPRDVEQLLDLENGYEREEEIINARINIRDLGPLVLWAEGNFNDQDLTLSPDASLLVGPGQGGSFERDITSLGAGAAVLFGKTRISLDVMSDDSDEIVVRTDYTSRLRMRARVDTQITKWFRLLGTAEKIDTDNNSSGVGYDAETEHYAIDLDVTPTDNLMFRLAWDNYTTDSRIAIRRPQDLSIGESLHEEDGKLLEASLQWHPSRFDLALGYSAFENDGSFPFELDRAFARVGVDFTKAFGIAFEYETREYSEQNFSLADYDADRVAAFIRWRN
jgi:hypothetical protein